LTRDHLRIGDMAAGTLLVFERAEARLPGSAAAAARGAGHLDAAGAEIVAELLERWSTLTPEARQRLARQVLERYGGGEPAASRLASDYRLRAHELARARTLLPDSRTREYLEAAYARAHATLHRGAWHIGSELLTLFRDEIPAVVRSLRPYIIWSTTIFAL